MDSGGGCEEREKRSYKEKAAVVLEVKDTEEEGGEGEQVVVIWNEVEKHKVGLVRAIVETKDPSSKVGDDIDHFRYALAAIWVIWKARNDLMFNDKITNTENMVRQAQSLFNAYKNPPMMATQWGTVEDQATNSVTNLATHWLPPPQSFTKINVDGACLEDRTAAGAIARDHHGGFVGCAAKALDFGTPITAEAHAFLLGITLIQTLNLSNVIIEGDAKVIIDWINDPTSVCDWRVQHTVQQCRDFMLQRSDISCSFSPRITNGVAHALANFSITHSVTNIWSEGLPPPQILDPIFADLALIDVDDLMLRRFLRARELDIEKASTFFLKYHSWRQTFLPKGFISEQEIPTDLAHNKVFLPGFDKQGRPIGLAFGGKHFPTKVKGGLDEFKRFVVYALEKVCSRIPRGQEKFIGIGDLKGWGYSNCDIRGYLGALSILQDCYPERLGKLYLVHVPYIFMTAWKLVYPFIDNNTRKKIVFVENKKLKSTLLEDIDESQLPEIYGGKQPLVPIQES